MSSLSILTNASLVVVVVTFLSQPATCAVVINVPGDSGTIDMAIFVGPASRIVANDSNAFLDLDDGKDGNGTDGMQSGFNSTHFGSPGAGTDGTNFLQGPGPVSVDDQEKSKNLPLSSVPTLTIGGAVYREFALAAVQNGNGSIDITDLQIGQHSTDDAENWTDLTNQNVYTMSSDDVTVSAGVYSGTGIDLFVYVPNSSFSSALDFVYLFTKMGGTNAANGGPERWLNLARFSCCR